ncbi:MAG TPA: hypothetical protein DEO65_01405 [Bacillus bacterium]|nr:hypothetical protein [Bacillus sp. (in: firmicutes)]
MWEQHCYGAQCLGQQICWEPSLYPNILFLKPLAGYLFLDHASTAVKAFMSAFAAEELYL